MLWKPCISETCFHCRQRRFDATDGATTIRSEPAFVARMFRARIPHDRLYVMHELIGRERPVELEELVIGMRYGDERNVHQQLTEKPGRYARRHDHIRRCIG